MTRWTVEAGVEAEELSAPLRQKRKRYQQVCRGLESIPTSEPTKARETGCRTSRAGEAGVVHCWQGSVPGPAGEGKSARRSLTGVPVTRMFLFLPGPIFPKCVTNISSCVLPLRCEHRRFFMSDVPAINGGKPEAKKRGRIPSRRGCSGR